MMRVTVGVAAVVIVAALGAGCGAKPQAAPGAASRGSPASPLNSNTDPCAMRLHDVCAPLLLFYGRYQSLPQRAEELSQVPGVDVPPLVCPESNQRYVYNPLGPSGPEAGTRIILYDATPAHAGRRWGIAVREPKAGQALVAKVVVLPESIFSQP